MQTGSVDLTLLLLTTALSVTSGQGPVTTVSAILNSSAFLPCDISDPSGMDSATLVLWFHEDRDDPVYSFDTRRRVDAGSHWNDKFNGRAFFRAQLPSTGLRLDNVREADAGFYRCRVDLGRSPTKNIRLRLDVIVPPEPPEVFDDSDELGEGTTRPYEEGATLNLKCFSRGGRPTPELQWWRGSTLLDFRTDSEPTFDDPDRRSASITIANITRSHYLAAYTCRAINNNRTEPAAKTVRISMYLAPLNVTIINDTQPLSAGRTYQIHCVTFGSVPPAKILWFKDSIHVLPPATKSNLVNEPGNKNISSSVLELTPTKNDWNTTIRCAAINPSATAWRKDTSWKLNVFYPPDVHLELGRELKPDDLKEGTDVYFHCTVQANPPAYKTVWKRNGIIIQPNPTDDILVAAQSLILRKVKREWMGRYTCEASNVEGDKESNAVELRIRYKPVCKPNQKLMYGAARDEHVKVMCEVDSNPEPHTFKWSFNHSQEPILEKRFGSGERHQRISVLTFTPRNEMDFGFLTCEATNHVGTQSVPCHYQIIQAAPPQPPQNCTAGNATMVSLEVQCRAGFDGGLTQTFLMEAVNSTTEILVVNVSSPEPYFKMNELPPGDSVLLIRVYAVNSRGRSPPFELQAVTEKAEKQTGLPSTLEITPFVGVIACVFVFILLFVLVVVCLAKRGSSSLGKSSRRPTSLCIKEKTHTSLIENCDREEKDPDLIPFKKNTGYQVLRTDANFDDHLSKSTTLPASNSHQHVIVNDHDLMSDNEQLSFIDCSEKIPSRSNGAKDSIVFINGENT